MTESPIKIPSLSLNSQIISNVINAISLATADREDPTLSENAKDIRVDLMLAALRYYRAIVMQDTCVRLIEASDNPDCDMPMDAIVGLLGLHCNEQCNKLHDQLRNLFEGFKNDKLKQASPKSD